MNRRLLLATAMLLAAATVSASAQTTPPTPPTRIRGTIASLNGNTLMVDSRDGTKLEIGLNDPLTVVTVTKVELDSIAPGSFIGTATRVAADGKQTALEVLVFPEAMRGAGEGHYPWDLEPNSMMTNGTVKGAVKLASGRELTVTYKDASTTVEVPPETPIVTFAPATREDLKPGAKVFLAGTKVADGKFTAGRVTVGKNGVVPPM